MEEILKFLGNVNINSDTAVQIAKMWMITECFRYIAMAITFTTLFIVGYTIVKNFAIGKWKA